MAISRSERNENRRDARLERAQALAAQQAKAQADTRKQTNATNTSKSSGTQQSSNSSSVKNTPTIKPTIIVDKVEISDAARKAATQNNLNTNNSPQSTPKTNSTPQQTEKQKVIVMVAPEGANAGGGKKVVDTNKNAGKSSDPRVDRNKDADYKPATDKSTGKTWGQAANEAAISSTAGTVGATAVEAAGKKVLSDQALPGAMGKITGLGISIVDIYNDAAANLSQGKTTFGSNKTVSQSVIEAGTGAILTEIGSSRLVTAAALTPAYSSLVPEQNKSSALLLGLAASYAISTADSKIGVSPGVAEYVTKETNRVKESGQSIKELLDRGNKKGYGDMSEKEKQAIDKAMKNVTDQNDRILKAKEKWIDADNRGDVAGKKAAEKEANDAREKGGRIGRDTSTDRVKELNEKIEKAKDKYREAEKIKDPAARQKAKDVAHEEANRYRSEGGTLG